MIKIKKYGFTLIEVLIVIIIIGILAAAVVLALNNSRAKARDVRRITDIKQMQTALELYYTGEQGYPSAWAVGTPLIGEKGGETFMAKMPPKALG